MRHDRVRQRRGRHPVPELVDEHVHAIPDEHLERCRLRGGAERVRVRPDKERTVDALTRAILHDRLRDGRDVGVVERRVEGGTPVPARAERDALRRDRDIRHAVVVGVEKFGDVDEIGCPGRHSRAIVHLPTLAHQ